MSMQNEDTAEPVYISLGRVCYLTGLARSTIFDLMVGNMFPRPARDLGFNGGWLFEDIRFWMDQNLVRS